MAEILGIACGIAGLTSLAMEISHLSYGYISDIRSAQSTQKQYLREISALTEVLLRSEEATNGLDNQAIAMSRPVHLSKGAIRDCEKELEHLRSELKKPSPSIFWPLKEKALEKHIRDLHQFRGIFSSFLAAQTLVTVSATHHEVTRLGNHQDLTELLEWIGNPKDASGPAFTPSLGTGDWFIKLDTYQNWVVGNSPPQLWCYGPPGVGKSMLASVAIQHLSETVEGASTCLLHYFCDFASRKKEKEEAIWRSLLQQIIAQRPVPVLQAFASSRVKLGSSRLASSKDLYYILDTICSSEQVVIVFDAPDELENVKDMITILSPFTKNNCRILVTSRDLPEIRSSLTLASVLEVQADENDLRAYVANKFEENDLEDMLDEYSELQTEIVDKSNGVWVNSNQISNRALTSQTVSFSEKFWWITF
jgi:hypothetical protein